MMVAMLAMHEQMESMGIGKSDQVGDPARYRWPMLNDQVDGLLAPAAQTQSGYRRY